MLYNGRMVSLGKVTKAVITAAGLGTRFLPATVALPKELLPVLDRPVIHYAVAEAAAREGAASVVISAAIEAEVAQLAAAMEENNRRVRIQRLLWRFQKTIELKPLSREQTRELVSRWLDKRTIRFTSDRKSGDAGTEAGKSGTGSFKWAIKASSGVSPTKGCLPVNRV